MILFLGIHDQGHRYERKVYDYLNFFGYVGGFIEVLNLTAIFLVKLLCTNVIESKTVKIFFQNAFEINPCDTECQNRLDSISFQFKYFIYRYICCNSKLFKKCYQNHNFYHDIGHLKNDLNLINESLSLKATMKYNNVIVKEQEKVKERIKNKMI